MKLIKVVQVIEPFRTGAHSLWQEQTGDGRDSRLRHIKKRHRAFVPSTTHSASPHGIASSISITRLPKPLLAQVAIPDGSHSSGGPLERLCRFLTLVVDLAATGCQEALRPIVRRIRL
jgi:hypothetical protein